MNYWETIADGLRGKNRSVGGFKFTSTIDGAQMWSADATKGEGKRIVVQAEGLGAAFLELEMPNVASSDGWFTANCRD